MAKVIENITGSDIVLADIGVTVVASGTYGLTSKPVDVVAGSNDLVANLSNGNLKLRKTDNPLVYYSSIEAIKILTLIPFSPKLDLNGNPIFNTVGLDHIDGRISIHESSRPIGTLTYFTGKGDDRSIPDSIGNGTSCYFKYLIGGADPSIYIDFNTADNLTFIHEAYLMYKGCIFDTVTAEIVPWTTAYSVGTNTNYNIYGGYLLIPAAGDGVVTINAVDMQLVYMPLDQSGKRTTAYWNATWNTTTKVYDNIVSAPLGDGEYNMFTAEVVLQRFLNNIPLLGATSSPFMLQTADSHQFGDGMRLKVSGITNTNEPDHDWEFSFLLALHRAKTI